MARKRKSIRQFKQLLGDYATSPLPTSGWLFFAACLLLFLFLAGFVYFFSIPILPFALGSGLTFVLMLIFASPFRRSRSQIMGDARLIALSARIRPHFLFNSLNAVLGTIRSDPRSAERALESLAELFRALLQDPKELVLLSEELALCRQYLALEKLRLGDRLRVHWDIDRCPPDALIPPLILQPLLENAVYHGIEPLAVPGDISIRFVSDEEIIAIELSNPAPAQSQPSTGNQIALQNIMDRLDIFYGSAAVLTNEQLGELYRVHIILPYRSNLP